MKRHIIMNMFKMELKNQVPRIDRKPRIISEITLKNRRREAFKSSGGGKFIPGRPSLMVPFIDDRFAGWAQQIIQKKRSECKYHSQILNITPPASSKVAVI